MKALVGIGASTPPALARVDGAVAALASHPQIAVLAESRRYLGPGKGGVTLMPFVNAAVCLQTGLSPSSLLVALHAIERNAGRLRLVRNGPRTLDLDLLWIDGQARRLEGAAGLAVPHPRLGQRPFAYRPALEAAERAGLAAPPWLRPVGEDPWLVAAT